MKTCMYISTLECTHLCTYRYVSSGSHVYGVSVCASRGLDATEDHAQEPSMHVPLPSKKELVCCKYVYIYVYICQVTHPLYTISGYVARV